MTESTESVPDLATRKNDGEKTSDRYKELSEEIDRLLSLPLPPPAEKHLLREKLVQLEYQWLSESARHEGERRWQFARAFALKMVPQNVFSYPMHLRETRVSIVNGVDYRELYGKSATHARMRREIDALAKVPGNEANCQERRLELAQLEFERTRAMDPTEIQTDERLIQLARYFSGVS